MTKERAIAIARDYITNDLAAADTGYVIDVLDSLGVTDEELEELGLPGLRKKD